MTRFKVGQTVRSTVSAQAMTKGCMYEVTNIRSRSFGFGTFVEYELRSLDGFNTRCWVGNGHLLLTEVAS